MATSEASANPSPALIALDWGTSSLRAYLLGADGSVQDSRSEPWGIMRVPRDDLALSFERMTSAWRARAPEVPAIAAGMIGSVNGWVHAPYCDVPAGLEELSHRLAIVPGAALSIVPGIVQRGSAPDVMRGEETQIVGCLSLHPAMSKESLLVLPGTHSKWARIENGRVRAFTTFMTGELFDVLLTHSTLGRVVRDAGPGDDQDVAGVFARGVMAAQEATNGASRGIASLLFSVRALVLTEQLHPAYCMEYLSGLLIGDELRCGLAERARPDALIGDPTLCEKYVEAFELLGIRRVPVIADAARAGLWAIAQHASLPRPTDERATT